MLRNVMSTIIVKYELQTSENKMLMDESIIGIHTYSKILKVGRDPSGVLCIWASADIFQPKIETCIRIVGTGQETPPKDDWTYLDSVVCGVFVWHVFIERQIP